MIRWPALRRHVLWTLAATAALASCAPRPAPSRASLHYQIGAAWQGRERTWFYPTEQFALEQTGLVSVAPARRGLTADGELYDSTALAAGHQTVQLPAIARVTNLQNGRQIVLRINDRGPATASRLLELTPRAAELLQVPSDGTAQIRLQVLERESRQLAERLQPVSDSAAMPALPPGEVHAADLLPPNGVAQSTRGRRAPAGPLVQPAVAIGELARVPDRMPEQVLQGPIRLGTLVIHAGEFGRLEFAQQVQARLSMLPVRIERSRVGRSESYLVRVGPFTNVPQADAALDRALRAGVTDARIVVE
jgi:rare lipoprotein A